MVLTQYGTIETAVEATRLGATDYVTKPFHVDELQSKIDRLIHTIEVDQGKTMFLREQLRTRARIRRSDRRFSEDAARVQDGGPK